MSRIRRFRRRRSALRASVGRAVQEARLIMEPLEARRLLTADCPVISGYVFCDVNNNGIFDAGETPLANSNLVLKNSQNVTIATAVSDSTGYYQFNSDSTISQAPKTISQTLSFPSPGASFADHTDWTDTQSINQFDSSLGTLTEVDISYSGGMTTQIGVENVSTSSSNTITASVSGSLTLTGQSIGTNVTITSVSDSHTDTFGIFDNDLADQLSFLGADFAGTSGTTYAPVSNSGSVGPTVITSAATLALFTGPGTLPYSMNATATPIATDTAGNFASDIESTATGSVTVVYKYIPDNCIQNGNYTIVQTSEPAGAIDGKDSHLVNGVQTAIANSDTTDSIPVTVNSADVPHNDFGEVILSSLSGYVYNDINNDGIKQSGEPGVVGATVTLTGTNDKGQAVNLSMQTDVNGFYSFTGLRPGTNYKLTETQPLNFLDGKDAIGTQGGTTSNDMFSSISLCCGTNGINNNFGEIGLGLMRGQTGTIGFWANKNGQAVINALGSTTTSLGNWLASSFPNLYGSSAGADNFVNKSRSYIASQFVNLFNTPNPPKLDAQVLAIALAMYTTTKSLNSTSTGQGLATKYGFVLTAANSSSNIANIQWNVGSSGAPFGVANNTSLTILALLQKANYYAVKGVLWPSSLKVNNITYSSASLRAMANVVFTDINNSGDII